MESRGNMSGADTLDDMQQLLASIREAIHHAHEETRVAQQALRAEAPSGLAEENFAHAGTVAAASVAAATDDDGSRGGAGGSGGESARSGSGPHHPAATGLFAEEGPTADKASASHRTPRREPSPRASAVVMPLYPAADAGQPSAPGAPAAGASAEGRRTPGASHLPPKVQARVKSAMARLERIEAARRALGGEEALRQLVADLVEPLLKEWLEENLAEIVERRVAQEIARITGLEAPATGSRSRPRSRSGAG